MWHGVEQYIVVVAVIALVVHSFLRRYLLASAAGAALCSVANMVHEAWLVGFQVNVAWAPFLFVAGAVLALPIFLIVGLPFLLLRRRGGWAGR